MEGHGLLHGLMGRMFHWLQGRAAPKARAIDLSLGHPQVPVLAASLESGAFERFETIFTNLAVDERFVSLSALAQGKIPWDAINEWVAKSDSFVAPLFKGTALTYQAWEARGGSVAEDVSEEAFEEFYRLLDKSWEQLTAAHRMAESEPEPLTRMIPVAMGLEVSRDTLDNIFATFKATGVPHLGATMYMIDAVSPKWLGSSDEVFAFARSHAAHFPSQIAGIAHAHVEHWLYENKMRANKASEDYFMRRHIQQEIRECWQQEADMASRTDYFRFAALNMYAFCFLMMQDDALLTQALNLIGDRCTPKPWAYASQDPYWLFAATRAELELPPL